MVLGSHVIFGTYGFWLPNDPRGSWSDFVGSWELAHFGTATKTDARHSLAAAPHDCQARLAAKRALKYPPIRLSGEQARAVGRGFAQFVRRAGLTIWACSILPEHVYLALARHRSSVEQIANHLKGAATKQIAGEGLHPLAAFSTETGRLPKAWQRGQWKVFLNNAVDIQRAISYVQENPMREGRPPQSWSFVREFEGAALPDTRSNECHN